VGGDGRDGGSGFWADCRDSVLLCYFSILPDAWQAGKVIYPLDEVLLLSLLGVLAGAESFAGTARFGEKKLELLRRFFPRPRRLADYDADGNVVAPESQPYEALPQRPSPARGKILTPAPSQIMLALTPQGGLGSYPRSATRTARPGQSRQSIQSAIKRSILDADQPKSGGHFSTPKHTCRNLIAQPETIATTGIRKWAQVGQS
jgi:hypothetical protein